MTPVQKATLGVGIGVGTTIIVDGAIRMFVDPTPKVTGEGKAKTVEGVFVHTYSPLLASGAGLVAGGIAWAVGGKDVGIPALIASAGSGAAIGTHEWATKYGTDQAMEGLVKAKEDAGAEDVTQGLRSRSRQVKQLTARIRQLEAARSRSAVAGALGVGALRGDPAKIGKAV